MATRPPRITSTRRQPTTRARRQPSLRRILAPSWGRPATPQPKGVTATSVPSAPALPAYSTSNLPPDASYDAQIASLQRQRADQLAQVTQARTGTLTDYGFTEGPNGALAFDPRNPFSKAALLKKAYDTNRRSTGQSMGAGGQLYSGAFQNAQDLVNRNQLQSEDAMRKAIIGFLAQNTRQRASAGTNYELAAQQAEADRIGRFQTNPLYDPAASAPDAPGATGGAPAGAPAGGTKVARGFVWTQNSNGTWRKVRPVNAFGR